jgi:hypothetical protein
LLFKRLYEDNVLGRIPNEHFRLSSEYTTEQAKLREKLPKMEERLEKLRNALTNVAQFIDKAKRYSDITELTPEILHLFIEKIVVGEKSQKYSRTAEQDIWIYYRDIGLLDTPWSNPAKQKKYPRNTSLLVSRRTPNRLRQKAGRTAETVRPITGIYTRFTFCPYDTPHKCGGLFSTRGRFFWLRLGA